MMLGSTLFFVQTSPLIRYIVNFLKPFDHYYQSEINLCWTPSGNEHACLDSDDVRELWKKI